MTSGPYTVERVLGRGATAVVELARDGHGELVAVKRLALHGTAQEMQRARRRIRREAEVLAKLRHPAILPLLAVEDDGYDLLIVTGYAAGGSLRERVARDGPMSVDEVSLLAGPLLDALATLHRHGVVHRDITPSNVLFRADGQPVLADFDMASWRGHTAGLTGDGLAVGTPGFMAPEQARGEGASPASDVFGLAATLVYALTGSSPYGAGSPELLAWKAAQGDVEPPPAGLPPAMGAALAAMLSPAPQHRPTAAAVRGGPTGTLQGAPPQFPRLPAPSRAPGRRRRVLAVAGIVAAVTVTAVAAVAGLGNEPGSTVAGRATPEPIASVCTELPYQPCTQRIPAPFTDGKVCISGHDDFDGDRVNGCEAAPDPIADGTILEEGQPVSANVVPAADVDRFRVFVQDKFQLLCNGAVAVTVTAPPAVADRVEVLKDGKVIATAISYEGKAASARIADPSCGSDNSGWYDVRITSVAGRSAAAYRLVATGHL